MGILPRSVNYCRQCAKQERQLLRLASIAGQSKYGNHPLPPPYPVYHATVTRTLAAPSFLCKQNTFIFINFYLNTLQTYQVCCNRTAYHVNFARGFHTFCMEICTLRSTQAFVVPKITFAYVLTKILLLRHTYG